MKYLITGGAGYIGSVLAPMLLEQGHQVTVVDNFMYQQSSLLDACHFSGLKIIRGDARDVSLLKQLVPEHDVLVPLACLVGAPVCAREPQSAVSTGRDAVIEMHKLKAKGQMLIYPCTNSGYGIGSEGVECTEESPLKPVSLYGRLKVEAEEYLLSKADSVTFRFATVFGISPRMRLDLLVNDFTYRAVTDKFVVLFEPHFKRNYLHVRDAANAFIHAVANYDRMEGKAFNVGLSDANLNKIELCAEIEKQVPQFRYLVSEVGEDPDKRNYVVSNRRIEATGFKTKVSLQEGIAELIKGYQVVRKQQYSNV